jgi:hypothetical protein
VALFAAVAVSPCVAAGRLFTVRTVIRLSYALVVGTPKRYYLARRACIGSLHVGLVAQDHSTLAPENLTTLR